MKALHAASAARGPIRRVLPARAFVFLFVALSASGVAAHGDELRDLWRSRASGFDRGALDPRPTERLITLLEDRLAAEPADLESRLELLEALYFDGYFLTDEAGEQRHVYERMVELARQTLELAGTDDGCVGAPADDAVANGPVVDADCTTARSALVRGHFWAAISWGLWGMSHSRLSAASHDVAGKIRDHAQRVIELDPEFADGGGYRLLGRLHTATPRIPLFTGWIDRDLGLELLERANAISIADPRNPLFLAEALLRFRPEERRRAHALLEEVAAREPRPEHLVEESETIERARELLAGESAG